MFQLNVSIELCRVKLSVLMSALESADVIKISFTSVKSVIFIFYRWGWISELGVHQSVSAGAAAVFCARLLLTKRMVQKQA